MYLISKYFCLIVVLTCFQISSANPLTGLLSKLLKINKPVILVVEESQIPKREVAKTKQQNLNHLYLDYRDESQIVPSGNVRDFNLDLIPNIQNRQRQVLLLKKPKESRNVVKNRLYEPLLQQLMMLRSGCYKNVQCRSECQDETADVDDCNDNCNKKFECPQVEEEKSCGDECEKEPSNECAESGGDDCQDGGSTKGYKETQKS